MAFVQNPIPTFTEAQMLAQLPTAGNFYFFYNADKDGDLYMVDSAGTFTFVADSDADEDCCTCAITEAWMCAINFALKTGQITYAQYQTLISTGIKITSTNTGNGNCSLTVTSYRVPPTSVVVTSSSSTMPHNSTMRMAASVLPAGADPSVFWTVSDTAKAVIDQTGLLIGRTAGVVTVYAYSVDDSSIFGTKDITLT